MAYVKSVYKVGSRYEYVILADGEITIRQDFHPDEPGLVEMSEATANECADIVLARLASTPE